MSDYPVLKSNISVVPRVEPDPIVELIKEVWARAMEQPRALPIALPESYLRALRGE